MTDEEIIKKANRLINQEDINLLIDLIQFNRIHGKKSDEEIIELWNQGYESLHKYRNSKGKIDVEFALQVIQDDIDDINEKMSNKLLEQNLHRKVTKQGYTLKKSRAAYTLDNQGGYMIIDQNNYVVAGEKYDFTLDDVKKFLEDN